MISRTEPVDIGPIVLDSSAFLALCVNEPGADHVERAISASTQVFMTAVNLAESTSRLLRLQWTVDEVEAAVRDLDIEVIRDERALALLAGELHARTRSIGLSMGDALCLAAALRDAWPVFTADRVWTTLQMEIPVVVIR
jgi:PIN domain nuclease of toxin-antitoxin system